MFHWQNIVSRNQTTSRYRASYEINPFTINSFIKLVDRMAVIEVWAFILCTRHRRHKTKEQTIMKTYQADFPWTENKEVFYFTSSVSSTRSFDWNLESINICTNCQFILVRKKCTFDSQLMHVDRELRYWSPSTLLLCGHFIRIHSCMSICFSCMYTNITI